MRATLGVAFVLLLLLYVQPLQPDNAVMQLCNTLFCCVWKGYTQRQLHAEQRPNVERVPAQRLTRWQTRQARCSGVLDRVFACSYEG